MREENEIENVKEVEGNVFAKDKSNNILKKDFIKEERYQKVKKEMGKKDDYFTVEELKKISVILA